MTQKKIKNGFIYTVKRNKYLNRFDVYAVNYKDGKIEQEAFIGLVAMTPEILNTLSLSDLELLSNDYYEHDYTLWEKAYINAGGVGCRDGFSEQKRILKEVIGFIQTDILEEIEA